ncbi:M48 family metalloprotease [Legionella dresdenensis]|uniref:M48 family metalloprotease n=1 Tax=Legionella dresdenensis TaxID=450200 RepID=A0ABV8CES6_9GAMM
MLFCNPLYSFSPYSNQELDELEKEFVQQINQADSVERHPLATQYINHIGKQLAAYGHIRVPYFFIVKSIEINAFAGPGGYIGINSQLILASENESELAAVMAHEIAHVRLHHLYRMLEHQKQMQIPMLASLLAAAALGAINPTLGSGAMAATMTGFAQDNINFTRANEKEADRIGISMLSQAGFDPRAMAGFFKKMQQSARYYYTANIPAILRTHPLDEDRIAEAENRSFQLKNKDHADSMDYFLFKELLRNDVARDSKQLLEYYQHGCNKKTPAAACAFGHALALLGINQFGQAKSLINPLLAHDNNNLFYQIAMAQAETGNKEYEAAIKRLQDLQTLYPENYAALMAYGQGLLAAGKAEKASAVLLKGSRRFKKDLILCEQLARAQSAANQKAYAYFTEAQCQLLQGRHREALRSLRQAKILAKNDRYLLARTDAMMDEVKFLAQE